MNYTVLALLALSKEITMQQGLQLIHSYITYHKGVDIAIEFDINDPTELALFEKAVTIASNFFISIGQVQYV